MQPVRFIQSSDFHLEQPPHGLAEVPDHLRELLIEAPYRAANNVFDLALRHEVDFVVLAGDLLDPHASGPRGFLFLEQQFNRLAEHKIAVYWLPGEAERWSEWSTTMDWPANVHVLSNDTATRCFVRRDGQACAELIGHGRSTDRRPVNVLDAQFEKIARSSDDLFTIGVAYGDLPQEAAEHANVDYWALGGEHDPTLPVEAIPIVHYSGSPQGRSPAESDVHGCTLVQVDEQGRVQTTPLTTDVVRFVSQRMLVDMDTSRETLEQQLCARMQSLLDSVSSKSVGSVNLVVTWSIATGNPQQYLSLANYGPRVLSILRGEFGYRTPAAWCASLSVETPKDYPNAWLEQDTLLGDFLRAARRHDIDPRDDELVLRENDEFDNQATAPFDLSTYMPEHVRAELLARVGRRLGGQAAVGRATPGLAQRSSLRAAAWLGASLLSPEEATA